jgi:hypothetical protein
VLGFTGRLGWTTWLGARIQDRDADDLVLHPPTRLGRGVRSGVDPAADGLNRNINPNPVFMEPVSHG